MTSLFDGLRRVAEDLAALRVEWALIGGLAINVHVEPRTTRDIDLALAVRDDRAAQDLIRRLHLRGYEDNPEGALIEQKNTGRLATFRLLAPNLDPPGLALDLLFASSGIEPEVVARASLTELVPGLSVPIAHPEDLLALKILANRPHDRLDALALLRLPEVQEIRVRQRLHLISARGADRGFDLQEVFSKLLGEWR